MRTFSMTEIKFGTSGWRAVIARDFTFDNLRAVIQAISDYVKSKGDEKRGIIVGRDCRFMGDTFAREAGEIFAGNGIKVFLSKDPVPTPTISHAIIKGKLAGAINITASHNPFYYSGVKYSPDWGGPALPETTKWIEGRANELVRSGKYERLTEDEAKSRGLWEEVNLKADYLKELTEKVDLDTIKKVKGKIAYDPIFSAGGGYLDHLLIERGIDVITIHEGSDPYFGGGGPDPSGEKLVELSKLVRDNDDIILGLATDGDADRFGIIDFDGTFIEPNYIIALLIDYLIEERGFSGGAARTVATTHLVDAVASYHNVNCFETPVGFKYIGQYIAEEKIAGGGEESAGFSILGHVPEKDGIIACLLTLEMVSRKGKTIKGLLDDLYRKVGRLRTKRLNLRLTEELERKYSQKMDLPPSEFSGKPVKKTITIDGNKFVLDDGSWILFRKSGTEPVVRLYAEAENDLEVDRLIESGERFIMGD